MLENLETFFDALNRGMSPRPPAFGFLHPEPTDVLAIDQSGSRKQQKGGGHKLTQTRLYVYPDTARQVLYLLTLGDKSSQRDDIEACKRFVAQIRTLTESQREGPGGQDEGSAPGAADEADG